MCYFFRCLKKST